MAIAKLIVVYNADEGWSASLMDAMHKVMKPSTYQCSLCAISYGAVSMRSIWKKYLDNRPEEKLFLHKQDFERAYPDLKNSTFPAIKLDRDGHIETLLNSRTLDQISDVDGLIAAMDEALAKQERTSIV